MEKRVYDVTVLEFVKTVLLDLKVHHLKLIISNFRVWWPMTDIALSATGETIIQCSTKSII